MSLFSKYIRINSMYKEINYNSIKIKECKTIRNAMIILNKNEERFLLVINQENKFLGTITDGDIRRAIIKGISIDKSVKFCMNKKPVIAKESNKNYEKLFARMPSTIKFLPVIDKNKKIKTVLLDNIKEIERTALIMAGGFGKRLGNITKNTPKPLLKIKSKPILEIILQRLEAASYKNIYISTHYLHDRIEAFIKARKSKAEINLIYEPKPKGTAGSIFNLKEKKFKNLTVLNADIISEINLDALNQFHLEKKYDLTLTVAYYNYNIPFGVIDFDNNFKFKSLSEKPSKKYFILSGIYCLSKRVCDLTTEKYLDMPELINQANKLDYKIGVFPIYEYWNDVGTYKSLTMEKARKKK